MSLSAGFSQGVSQTLHETLDFLTGDKWQISFCQRQHPETAPLQGRMTLPGDVAAVIPFSDGLDSRAVAGIMMRKLGDKLVRVRLGSKAFDAGNQVHGRQPFTSVPYKVQSIAPGFAEPTARSRGFKFALLSGLAAYLAQAGCVIVPESGQGALGPTLAPVGQAYPDYRSHPLFTTRMEKLLKALLDYNVCFEFPQLWRTKGETLSQFVRECPDGLSSWATTWSCWQQNRHVSVGGRKRQCGICAACMLRRLSIHAAGLSEPKAVYVWEDLTVPTLDAGAAAGFGRENITGAMREYAIAGTLHLDHLAWLSHSPSNELTVALAAFQLGRACALPETEARARLNLMLRQHECEWKAFILSLGSNSFIAGWTDLADEYDLDQTLPADVGERLRIARESTGITQADAATAIEVARTTLVAIEQGQRRVRINELQSLARLYGTTVNALLRQEAVHVDLAPRFRRNSADTAATEAVQLMADLAGRKLSWRTFSA